MVKKAQSEILTIMFVDLTSYTEISSKLNRADFDQMHDVFDELCKPTFSEFSGEVIKKLGDAFLITFKSPTDAMLCSIALQQKFKRYNLEMRPKLPLKIKVAVHSGEVLIKDNDIYGDAVNVVSRLAGKTPSTNIYFTKSVYLSMNKNEFPFSFVELMKFKGVKDPVHVSRVDLVKGKSIKKRKKFPWFLVLIALMIFGFFSYYTFSNLI